MDTHGQHRFGCLQHARGFCGPFFSWYNGKHRHGGLALLTPRDVHYGHGIQRLAHRAAVLAAAYAAHPERFPHGVPAPGALQPAVWINKPVERGCEEESELTGSVESADLGPARGRSTPANEASRPREEERLLVVAH